MTGLAIPLLLIDVLRDDLSSLLPAKIRPEIASEYRFAPPCQPCCLRQCRHVTLVPSAANSAARSARSFPTARKTSTLRCDK
jgi:hypothetical protein